MAVMETKVTETRAMETRLMETGEALKDGTFIFITFFISFHEQFTFYKIKISNYKLLISFSSNENCKFQHIRD
jgi:hypothetical protein